MKTPSELAVIAQTKPWSTPKDLNLPYETWRPNQAELIRTCSKPGIHVLEAPTGTGKSGIAIGLAESYRQKGKKAFVVVGSHQLQDQYQSIFGSNEHVLILKGKEEYQCELNRMTDASECQFALADKSPKECPVYTDCGYYQARDRAITGNYIVVMTYAFFTGVRQSPLWPKPDVVVFDEAHDAARHVTDFVAFDFTYKTFESFGVSQPLVEGDVIPCIQSLHANVRAKFLEATEWFGTVSTPQKLRVVKRLKRMNEKLLVFLDEYDESWVIDLKFDRVFVSPLWATNIAERYLWGDHDTVLFMSATIGDPSEFAFELGLTLSDCEYIELDSPFPVENREVAYVPWVLASGEQGKAFDNNVDAFMEKFDALMEEVGDLKVLVHTVSYQRAETIYLRSKFQKEMLLAKREDDKFPLLEEFKRREGRAILLGPCFETGIDLPDDQCRVNLIIKVPYPDLGDKKTKLRIEDRRSWQNHITSVRIVQAAGRGVRHDKDWAITMITDANFGSFRCRAKFPEWFAKSIV